MTDQAHERTIPALPCVQLEETSETKEPSAGGQSRLAKAVEAAAILRASKGDDQAAVRLLDAALYRDEECMPIDRARALAARAELAIAEGDRLLADALLHELQSIPLLEADRQRYRHELEAASELERQLTPIEAPTNP